MRVDAQPNFPVHELLDDVPVIIWEMAVPQWAFRYVSRHAETLIGYPVERWLEDPGFWLSLIHPDDMREIEHCQKETMACRDHEVVYRMRHKDGHYVWLQDTVSVAHQDGVAGSMRGAMVDITPLKTAETELKETRDSFDLLADNLEQVFWVRSRGKIVYVSPGYERVWGQTTGSLYKDPSSFLAPVHPHDLERLIDTYNACIKAQKPFDAEYRIMRDKDDVRWVRARCSMTFDDQDNLVHEVGIAEDITDERAAEARQRHQQKLESLGVLAGGIAHDFNNLLVGILGHAELAYSSLKQQPFNPGTVPDQLRQIQRGAEKAADLCRQMLAYAGQGNYSVRTIDLRQQVHEIGDLLEASLEKGTLRYQFPEEPTNVRADPAQLNQLILNLVTNAADALHGPDGQIEIRLEQRECSASELSSTYLDDDLPAGSYLCLTVSDNGCGMDAATQARLFDPFFSTKFTGRGLGMASVLGIIRAHRGAIRVRTAPALGTAITAYFPHSAEVELNEELDALHASAEHSANESRPRALQSQDHLLIVDDEPTVLDVASRILAQAGFLVSTAATGTEAIATFKEGNFDGVLLDVSLPDLDGFEVLTLLREVDPDVRVVINSGYDPLKRNPREVDLSGCRFVQKPYRAHHLVSEIRQALD